MARISLKNVDVDYAVYDAQSRSLKNALLKHAVGGQLGDQRGHSVVVQALRDINLTLEDGDRIGLVGHNGAGKSTLLKVLAGIYEPVKGEVEIEGTLSSLTDMMMGMDSDASGEENVVTRAVFLGLSFPEAKAILPDVAQFSELGEYLQLPIRTYSSGMLMRLAFGVCTAVQPDILVMDEMISAGDQSFIEKAERRIKGMIEKAKILVLASHADELIRELCNKAVLMEKGRVLAVGTPDAILSRYGADKAKSALPRSGLGKK